MKTPLTAGITGLILAGGRGERMGGVDKGLQPFRGRPLVQQALWQLQNQSHPLHAMAINANRHLPDYQALGVPVWPDSMGAYAGPLAGFLAGLEHCASPLLLTVPCDAPLFPLDLVERLSAAMTEHRANIAMVAAPEADGTVRAQPVFCLLKTDLRESLRHFMASGGRKVSAWTGQHRCTLVPFDHSGDRAHAFANANTLAELQQLEAL